MEDRAILDCIHALVAQARRLRDLRDTGRTGDQDVERLRDIEADLDQMWDLLRHRRALRAAGMNPDVVDLRPSLQFNA
jgi:hypothetical protein